MASDPRPVPRWLDVGASFAWRLLVIGAALLAIVLLLAKMRLVVIPLVAALLLATLLVPVRAFLVNRGVPSPLAMLGTVLVFFGGLGLVGFLIVPPLVNEFSDIDATLEEAADEIEQWLIDGPFGLDRQTVVDGRERIEDSFGNLASSDGALMGGVILAGEVVAGALLALVVAFFVVKDGERIQRFAIERVPWAQRPRARAAARAAWHALGGYVLASAILGLVEGVIIGLTLHLVGADLVLPVASLTFLAAFFPFVGAVVAGLLASLVAFVSVNITAAIIVAVVALVVQQFDNDLLAPLLFGKALNLHPLIVILALSAGAALGGLAGAFLAVPTTAVVIRTISAIEDTGPAAAPPPEGAPPE